MSLLFVLALASADCDGCHPQQAEAFAASRHGRAATLAIYTRSAAKARTTWCRGCHQPDGRNTAGLTCLSCHAVDGDADAVRATRRSPSRAARHKTVVDPAFAVATCARCHQFNTPRPGHLDPVVYSSQPLQSTVAELRAADPRARCAACHDVHRGNGAHDPALVRGAVTFAARAVGDEVEIVVRAGRTGHRFPTGDPFRRVVVSVCADAACARVLGHATIARGFALRDGVWAPVVDRTLASGETRVLRLPRARYWRAELRYGDPALEAGLPRDEVALELGRGIVGK